MQVATQITRAARQIGYQGTGFQGQGANCSSTPIDVKTECKQAVETVVTGGDGIEHGADHRRPDCSLWRRFRTAQVCAHSNQMR